MTLVRRTNPFGELISLRSAMDRLFEDSFVRPANGSGSDRTVALDMYATADSFVVEAALPGIKPEDINVSVLGDTLTISANTSAEQEREDDGYSYREIRRGSYSRTVTLPTALKTDAATATFENGLLKLSFPKAEEAKPRQIEIKPMTEGRAAQVQASASENASTSENVTEQAPGPGNAEQAG
jgi:HSP20 family protein